MRRKPIGLPFFRFAALILALAAVLSVMFYLRQTISPKPKTDTPAPPVQTPAPTPEAAAPAPAAFPEPADTTPDEFVQRMKNTVTFVYDGDTIMTADGRRIRYVGVDTPERHEPFFDEATALNKKLVEMRPVTLTECKKKPIDKYGRTLATVSREGADVAEALLTAGLAEPFHDRECIADCRPYWKWMLTGYQQRRGLFRQRPPEPVPAVVADRLFDRYGLVVGVVDNVRESTKAYHLNFGKDWTTDFSVTISKKDIEPFLRDKLLPHSFVGLELTVFGKVVSSRGPRIFAVCPAQIVTVNAP
ncbi:MAG: thermonuclease family protein [Candidatus Lernaella stagnicola]|nr:thermonuclease family protein [Candidatus Lernaella stagnicola]